MKEKKGVEKERRLKVMNKISSWLRNTSKFKRENPDSNAEKYAKDYLQRQGLKFIYQKPISVGDKQYIADFYFPDTKLILEIDGGYHKDFEQRKLDIKRTEDLNKLGYKVVRIDNKDVYDFNYPKEIFNKTKKKVVKSK